MEEVELTCYHDRTAYYGEYQCYGPGANTARRVTWSRTLTAQEVKPFLSKDFIGGNSWIRSFPTSFKRRSAANSTNVN